MRLALIFDKVREDTVGVYFERACRELGVAYEHAWLRDAQRLAGGCDLYLRIDHGDYREDLPEACRPRVFYAIDTHLPKSWARIRALAKRYTLVCCAQRSGAQRLPNGAWVPLGCDPAAHAASPSPRRWDVGFIGTDGGVPRKFYLQALRERYPNSMIGHAPHTELGRIYGQSAVGFNYSIRGDVNMRMFEVLCSGTLLLTNRLPHEDLGLLGLRDGEHFVSYRSPTELFDRIDYYLARDVERQAIAARGRAEAMRRHTYRHRLQQMLSLASQRLGGGWDRI